MLRVQTRSQTRIAFLLCDLFVVYLVSPTPKKKNVYYCCLIKDSNKAHRIHDYDDVTVKDSHNTLFYHIVLQ